jgi:DNA-binding transcriptional LysR family regulator
MEAFVRAVEMGSFSAAARELKLTPSALSKLVTRLERALNVRLVTRSTKSIAPTPEGDLFLSRCRKILAEMQDAETEIGQARDLPRGKLRLHAGVGFGMSQLVGVLPRFVERHPEVDLDLLIEDRRVDLARENIDITLFTRIPETGNLVARELFQYGRITCASPGYLKRHGRPRAPQELAHHRCMTVPTFPPTDWTFQMPEGPRALGLRSRIIVNNAECKYRFALAGLGIAQFNEYVVADALNDGRLVEILSDFPCPDQYTAAAVYLPERYRLPRVAAMLDFLVESFSGRPWRQVARPRGVQPPLPGAVRLVKTSTDRGRR